MISRIIMIEVLGTRFPIKQRARKDFPARSSVTSITPNKKIYVAELFNPH